MVTFEYLEQVTNFTIFDIVKEYNILDFVYSSCKLNISDLQENVNLLDFVDHAELETDSNNDYYLDVLTDIIRVNIYFDFGIDSKFLVYFASVDGGEILTHELNKYDIIQALDNVNLSFS